MKCPLCPEGITNIFLVGDEKSIIILNELAFATLFLARFTNIVEFKVCVLPEISFDISCKNLGIRMPFTVKGYIMYYAFF